MKLEMFHFRICFTSFLFLSLSLTLSAGDNREEMLPFLYEDEKLLLQYVEDRWNKSIDEIWSRAKSSDISVADYFMVGEVNIGEDVSIKYLGLVDYTAYLKPTLVGAAAMFAGAMLFAKTKKVASVGYVLYGAGFLLSTGSIYQALSVQLKMPALENQGDALLRVYVQLRYLCKNFEYYNIEPARLDCNADFYKLKYK